MEKILKRHFAYIWESERGWGQNVIAVRGYDKKEDADAEVSNVLARLPDGESVPDYYIMARYSDDLNLNRHSEFVDGDKRSVSIKGDAPAS